MMDFLDMCTHIQKEAHGVPFFLNMCAQPLTSPAHNPPLMVDDPPPLCRLDQPEAVRDKLVGALVHGFASHHAGHLPGWKSLIERLFQRGLVKIVSVEGGGRGTGKHCCRIAAS